MGRLLQVTFAIVIVLLTATADAESQQRQDCPSGCMCFHSTVRCMFLKLEKLPQVPPETTILDLRFNRFKEIPPNAFKHLQHLNTLLLNNNQITRLQNGVFNGLKELKYLYLYKNRIREVESNVFEGLDKLEQLYLHFNKVEKLSDAVFSDLTKLQRLFLHNNKLQRIPVGAFKNLNSLKRLRLDSNALICDCEMLWLVQMLQHRLRETQAAATCQYPVAMQGKALSSMSASDFHCNEPKITEGPHDVEVSFGGTAFFTCKAEGDPQPDIVWMRDNNEINMGDPRYSKLADGTLMIENAVDADAGVYECMAKSAAGEAKSRAAKMLYHGQKSKPVFRRTPLDQQTQVGGTVKLYCTALGEPQPDITWTKDDLPVLVHADPRILVASDNTLTLTDVRREDAGQYKCTAANYVGRVTAIAQIYVNVLPSFTTRPENLTLKSGGRADFHCLVDGFPTPEVTWYKDGQPLVPGPRIFMNQGGYHLTVDHVKETDAGQYVCRAQNSEGSKETSAYLQVLPSPRNLAAYTPAPSTLPQPAQLVDRFGEPPRLLITPYDMQPHRGSTIEIPCRAEGTPRPTITWTKDGQPISQSAKFRVSSLGSLYISSISTNESGVYECIALNLNGRTRAHGRVVIQDEIAVGPGDQFVQEAYEEAVSEVDRAVADTLAKLFPTDGSLARSHSDLFRTLRYPDKRTRDVVRAADVYERTLSNIRKHVQAGMKINSTADFLYKDLLSPQQLALVANLSGCMAHRPIVNCSSMCFHSKYRSIDGTCNNLGHPMWGASLTGFVRKIKPIYENGFSMPVGWSKSIKYFGFTKPSARLVSTKLISTERITADERITHMVMQWGQFLDHDLDHAIPSVSSESWDGIDCKKSCDYAPPCYPIEIPPNDPRVSNRRCIDFVRSSAICGSGQTSLLFDTVEPREQINQLTAFIDASQVYGFSKEVAHDLRDFTREHGLLREGLKLPGHKALLPEADRQPVDCRRDPNESDIGCFVAGDIRANEQLGLLAMHTIWMREHNRIATFLRQLNPHWAGDIIYHEARKIVGAQIQHITYQQWLPTILGAEGMELLGPYKGYNPNMNPGISNIFATAALRFGHSLINPVLARLNKTFHTIPEGDVSLHKAFFSPWRLVDEGGVDPLLRGLFTSPAKLKLPRQNLNTDLTERLFEVAHAVALDLAAINIQRGRDHGIPGYTAWRQFCNLSDPQTFDDLKDDISSETVREELQKLYGHPGNVDVWVGGILEDVLPGAKVGPLFRCLLIEQFRRLREGDRFWYENPSTFKPEQLTQIRQTSLARVICDNGDDIPDITANVFLLPKLQSPAFLKCDQDIPKIELGLWAECCQDCQTNTISRRVRRSSDHSYPEEKPTLSNTSLPSATPTTLSNEVLPSPPTVENSQTPADINTAAETEHEADEERLEGIETALEEFQRTIKQLRRKIRKLEHHCQAGGGKHQGNKCLDSSHSWRKNNEIWHRDSCTQCVCKERQITCTTQRCPELTCPNKVSTPGECCSRCA